MHRPCRGRKPAVTLEGQEGWGLQRRGSSGGWCWAEGGAGLCGAQQATVKSVVLEVPLKGMMRWHPLEKSFRRFWKVLC